MTSSRRHKHLYSALLALMLAMSGWAYFRLAASRTFADQATRNEAVCRRLVEEIEALRSRPSKAALQEALDAAKA